MKICVQGLWHLGCVTAACLASKGHEVVGLDFDDDVIDDLTSGKPPLFEPGLEALIRDAIVSGNLTFMTEAEVAVDGVDVLWIGYDTPVDNDDNADVEYVINQIVKTLPHLPDKATVVVSSQIPVGSIGSLEKIAGTRFPEKDIGFAYSPENLRLGHALDVFLNPDRIVVGVRSERDRNRINTMLTPITSQIEWMSVESAEMTKHSINAFLATSITFANEVASICELVGADAKEVERGLKSEKRIGPKAYLSPGAAFAGGTLARDIAFLTDVVGEKGLVTPLLASVRVSNDEHKKWVRRKLKLQFPDFPNITVTVWGLTYKPGTNTLRRSLSVELCDWLIEEGISLSVHDPVVSVLPENWQGKVSQMSDPVQSLRGTQALVISTEWPEYKQVSADQLVENNPNLTVLDANRYLSHLSEDSRLHYFAVGSPAKDRKLP